MTFGSGFAKPNTVIVPTFSRPEMLWACLEHLAKCKAIGRLRVVVSVDWHQGNRPPFGEIAAVLKKFIHLDIKPVFRLPHNYPGNSYNVLTAYKEALEAGSEFTFLVEDDVMVEPDFFEWHAIMHMAVDLFCSVGTKNTRTGQLMSACDYASLGVCFPRQSLEKIVYHARPAYFTNMREYCKQNFDSTFANEDCEQDGLILRVMGKEKGWSCWPEKPKARHIGWYGYHRPENRPTGTLEERYQQVMARSAEHIN